MTTKHTSTFTANSTLADLESEIGLESRENIRSEFDDVYTGPDFYRTVRHYTLEEFDITIRWRLPDKPSEDDSIPLCLLGAYGVVGWAARWDRCPIKHEGGHAVVGYTVEQREL